MIRRPQVVISGPVNDRMTQETSTLDVESLVQEGRIKKARDGVKILGRGKLTRAITVRAHAFSTSAREKILAAGGKIEEIF